MKKQNNRYRNGNNNNNGYTLNYKFDSVSIAGKISGTALDLIRRYNDLAKEAQTCGNYVDMEIYRQYAEHYRKIVTEINERRQYRNDSQNRNNEEVQNTEQTEIKEDSVSAENTDKQEPAEAVATAENGYVETLPASEATKTLHVVEITDATEENTKPKIKRVYRRKTTKKAAEA